MTETSDYSTVNDAATAGNWTASGFDTPTLNNSASTTPIYIEGNACMWWPLKKGTTNGHAYEATPNQDISNGEIVVAFLNYPFSDLANIPISSMFIRVSSSATFTTNYAQWDAKAQILAPRNTPISGFTPVMIYPTNPDATSGTPNYADLESFGWVATTGSTADGKQGGFDWFSIVSWIGGHSETYTQTFFSQLNTHANPATLPGTAGKPLGCFSRAGDFYQTNINIKVGIGGTDTAVSVTETSKTIFFNNIEPEHNLGYIFENPNAGTSTFFLTGCVHFWNEQDGTDPAVFTGVANVDIFKLDGCSFARGGAVELPVHDTVSTTYAQNCTFDGCGEIDIGDITFEGNTISNATSGVKYTGTGTRRSKDNTYTGCTDALHFDTAQTISIDGDQFSGNTDDVHFSGTGTLTINAVNGSNISSSRVSGGGTVIINNAVVVSVSGLTEGTPVVFYATETVSPVTAGDLLAQGTANNLGVFTYDHSYNGDLGFTTRARNQGVATAAIADDNGSYTDETSEANNSTINDMILMPATPVATEDAYLLGHDEEFGGIKLWMTTAGVSSSGAGVIDSYLVGGSTPTLDNVASAYSQSFTGSGVSLIQASFWLNKTASPTGTLSVKLYSHSGTFGTSSVPNALLQTATTTLDVSTLTGTLTRKDFTFPGFTVANGTKYCIVVEYTNGDATNKVGVDQHAGSGAHAGNYGFFTGTWGAGATSDLHFEVSAEGEFDFKWQYWNGAWTDLSGVTDGTDSLQTTGEKYVTWTVPGDWATTTINSQGAYKYIRAYLAGGTYSTIPKARQVVLDVTRYLPFTQNNTITSSGASVTAVWSEDTISNF